VISGILLLDKPAGLSSNGVLQRVRRLLGAKKAGHVGSLDPLATGMLPICLGEATKVAADIVSGRKLYRFTIALGMRTTTGDVEGSAVEIAPVPPFEPAHVEEVLRRFHGRQMQIPPMYSALKRDGKPLYKLARAGIEVERAPREIEIFALSLLRMAPTPCGSEPPLLELEVLCSKGTYVRTLAEDLSRALGTLGHVRVLRRLYVEPFDRQPMQTLEAITAACESGKQPVILPPDAALGHLVAVSLDARMCAQVLHGQVVTVPQAIQAGRVRLYDEAGTLLGIGESDGSGTVRPRRLFNDAA